jgi:hypothetical protein
MAKSHQTLLKVVLGLGALLLLTACATQPPEDMSSVPGFFSGLFHGLFSFFALIAGVFSDIKVYNYPNTGWWYDFGFLIGAGGWGLIGWWLK